MLLPRERSFSALRGAQTYLRNTMTQQRLNSLMLLHVHKDETDKLDLDSIAGDTSVILNTDLVLLIIL